MPETRTISESEWQVMQVIWEMKSAIAAEVIAKLHQTGWSHRTVRTLLSRLVEKGILTAESDGNRYVYRPTVTRSKCVKEAGKSFLERVFAGDTEELLVHFVRQAKISPKQVARLKSILDQKREPDK